MPEDIRNFADSVRRSAVRSPGAPALISAEQVLTWAELDARVDQAAAGLAALELPTDQHAPARVAIALPNVVEFAIAYFAVLRAGLVAVPVNPEYTARELRHVLADSDTSVLIGTSAVAVSIAGIRDQLAGLRHVFLVGTDSVAGTSPFARLLRTGGVTTPAEAWNPDRLAVLCYTSGTAGAPMAAMLSHGALTANHAQFDHVEPPVVGQADVVLLALPLFHVYGLLSGLGTVAWHGACGVLADRFEPDTTLGLLVAHRVTVVAAVPQLFPSWSLASGLTEAFATVRLTISGAAPLDPAVAREFQALTGRPVHQGYGLAETAPVVTSTLVSQAAKAGSVGRPLPGVQVRLVSPDGGDIASVAASGLVAGGDIDELQGAAGTDPGVLWVRGANLFRGYWPDGRGGPDERGWWATADVAYADADGDLFLVDRVDEPILVNGFNVYPHEIELVLVEYPGVLEAAVVGVAHPATGQSVKAFVVCEPRAVPSAAELGAHCARNLAGFKCPSTFEFVADLPHTATGRVRKKQLENAGG